MSTFFVEVTADADMQREIDPGLAELGWHIIRKIPGPTYVYVVECATAPADIEGKLTCPILQRSTDGTVSVMDWGVITWR